MMERELLAIAAVVGFSIAASASQAAPILSVNAGQLTGATGINVAGFFYDVNFAEGSCIEVFNGCDELTDFTFQTPTSALAAADALWQQVFAQDNPWDLDANLTFGITGTPSVGGSGAIMTPYSVGAQLSIYSFVNYSYLGSGPNFDTLDQVLAQSGFPSTTSISASPDSTVWAVWAPSTNTGEDLPLPAPVYLLSVGLIGAMFVRRRRDV